MKSSKKAVHVVHRKLADGTLRTYRYASHRTKRKPTGRTIGDLIVSWERSPEWTSLALVTQRGYSHYIKPLVRYEHVLIERLERRQIIDIRNVIAATTGAGAATGFVGAASAMFGWGIENGWISHSPMAKMKRLKGGNLPAWSVEDVQLALANLPEHLRRAVVMALYTGARRGDLCALNWAAYDGDSVRFVPQKTHRTAPDALVIPCDPVLRAELDLWRKDAVVGIAGAAILLNKFGRRWQGSNLSKQLAVALAQIPGFPPGRNIHGLRKLAAATLAQNGCTLHEIAAITGHRSLAMLQLYTRSVDQERLARSAISRRRENGRKPSET